MARHLDILDPIWSGVLLRDHNIVLHRIAIQFNTAIGVSHMDRQNIDSVLNHFCGHIDHLSSADCLPDADLDPPLRQSDERKARG